MILEVKVLIGWKSLDGSGVGIRGVKIVENKRLEVEMREKLV